MKIDSQPLIPIHRATQEDELDQKLREVSKSYEKQFLREMVKAMRSSVQESDLIPKNMAERIYAEKMDEQYVENWGDHGGIGMAEIIYQDVKTKILGSAPEPRPLPKVMMPLPDKSDPPPVLKMQDEGFHMSAPAPEGASVRAPLPGIVRASYEDQGRNYVRLDHGAFGTSLLSFTGWSSARAQGESVEAGQDLGRVVGADRTLHWKWDGHKA